MRAQQRIGLDNHQYHFPACSLLAMRANSARPHQVSVGSSTHPRDPADTFYSFSVLSLIQAGQRVTLVPGQPPPAKKAEPGSQHRLDARFSGLPLPSVVLQDERQIDSA
jgi:hypothetical protein